MRAKKNRMNEMVAILSLYNPHVQTLAKQRFYGGRHTGKQLFNAHSHQLRNDICDKAQALEILLLVKEMVHLMDVKNFWFSKDELRLLNSLKPNLK